MLDTKFDVLTAALMWAAIVQSVYRLATGWTVRESHPGRVDTFRTCPDGPWGPPSLLYNGYRLFFPGVKRPRGGIERVDVYCTPPLGSHGLFQGDLFLYHSVSQAVSFLRCYAVSTFWRRALPPSSGYSCPRRGLVFIVHVLGIRLNYSTLISSLRDERIFSACHRLTAVLPLRAVMVQSVASGHHVGRPQERVRG